MSMFRIGEFAQIAQVSARQLRHYDQLGLLRPDHTDQHSGYRYYSIRQLQRLNRILALKDLGLSLEQISPLLEDQISTAELRGMLTMRRAQVEQSLQAEEARLRHIDSRIAEIDRQGRIEGYDVVVKPVAAMPFVSLRRLFDGMDEVVPVLSAIAREGTKQIPASLRDKLMVVARNDEESEKLDLEIGFSLSRHTNASFSLSDGSALLASELPAVPAMATIVRSGTNAASHSSFAAIGTWIEAHRYQIAGACREVFLEPITGPPGLQGALVEIQFPVRRAA
jgi:DNA-binding transcriptional MerR regulator